LIIGALLNISALGIYAAITNITAQINALSALPVQPLLPLVSQIRSMGEKITAEGLGNLRQAIQMNTVVALGTGAALCYFAPEIVELFIPGAGVESVLLFRLATVIYALYSMNASGYYILLGAGLVGACMKIVFCVGFLTVLAVAGGAYWFGLPGGMAGNVVYIATLSLTLMGFKRLRIPFSEWRKWLAFPVIWYAALIPAGFFLDGTITLRISLFVLALAVLGKWWMSGHQTLTWATLKREA